MCGFGIALGTTVTLRTGVGIGGCPPLGVRFAGLATGAERTGGNVGLRIDSSACGGARSTGAYMAGFEPGPDDGGLRSITAASGVKCASSEATSAAVWYRSPGFFFSKRATMSPTICGMSLRPCRTSGAGSSWWRINLSMGVPSGKGTCPRIK